MGGLSVCPVMVRAAEEDVAAAAKEMQSRYLDERAAACKRLAAMEATQEVVAAMVDVLKSSGNWQAQNAAGEVLSKMGPRAKAAVPALIGLMKTRCIEDEEGQLFGRLFDTLSALGDEGRGEAGKMLAFAVKQAFERKLQWLYSGGLRPILSRGDKDLRRELLEEPLRAMAGAATPWAEWGEEALARLGIPVGGKTAAGGAGAEDALGREWQFFEAQPQSDLSTTPRKGTSKGKPIEPARAVSGLPLGHKDFYPSPERPVGFRGDGNACYPGATPVTEFWDGTPAEVEKQAIIDSWGHKITWFGGQHLPGRSEVLLKVWDVADEKSKNIVWKTRLPGWTMAGPIVVGDRVCAVGHPDWLTCLDAHTGKVLWQKRVLALELDGKTPEEAARLQRVIDIGVVFRILAGQAHRSMFMALPLQDSARMFGPKLLERLPVWRKTIEEADNDPAILAAFDLAAAAVAIRARGEEFGPSETDLKEKFIYPVHDFLNAVEARYGVLVGKQWMGFVGNFECTPVSDGERVYVVNDQLAAAYDLNGNRLWGWRWPRKELHFNGCNTSPRLCDSVLIVNNGLHTWYGLDATTGRVLWKSKQQGSDGNDYHGGLVLSLAAPDGKSMQALLSPRDLAIRRAEDDEMVGQVPLLERNYKPMNFYHVLHYGNLVWIGKNHSTQGAIFRLLVRDSGKVDAVTVQDTRFDMHWPLHTATPGCIAPHDGRGTRSLLDFESGTKRGSYSADWPEGSGDHSRHCVAIGRYIFEDVGARGNNCWWRGSMSYGGGQGGDGRPTDRKAMVRYAVTDVANPKAPRVVSNRNLLQEPGPASDIYVEQHLDGIDPFLFAGCYHGSASYFGCVMDGPVASGNRVFVQSVSHLRCIGDPDVPYDWNSASRPERVTKALKGGSP